MRTSWVPASELTLRLAVTGIITVLLLVLGVLGEMTACCRGRSAAPCRRRRI
ncbi:MAG: hypothetical protein ACLS8R_05795 [Anaeromassilibacillus sp.]